MLVLRATSSFGVLARLLLLLPVALVVLLVVPIRGAGGETPPTLDAKSFARCQNEVRRSFEWLDRDGDGRVSDHEVRASEALSGVGLQESDEEDLAEGCYHFSRMSVEDVQMYLSRCTKNDMFLAHFSNVDGAEMFGRLLDPAMSERTMHDMLIPVRDRVRLRRRLFKQLLKADRAHILARERRAEKLAPRVTDVRATQLTVHLPQNPGARGYKVQYCQEDDGKAVGANVDVCGFAWSAVYPTAGVATVYLHGLLPKHSYQIRVRSFYCDSAGIISETITVVTDAVTKAKFKSKPLSSAAAAPAPASAASRLARLRERILAHPPKLRRVSASRDTVLLSWDGGCRIDSNVLQTTMASVLEAPTPQRVDGSASESSIPGTDTAEAAAAQVMHAQVCLAGSSVLDSVSVTPISWEVLYKRDEFGWSGGWETAGCAEARRVDNMNDGPFTCFVKDLKEGRRYQFKVRGVFNNVTQVTTDDGSTSPPGSSSGDAVSLLSIEVESDVKRHMTGCDDDADCYGEKVCTPSFKCVKPYFSWTNLVYIIAGLAVMAMVLYACLVPGGLGSKNAFRVLKLGHEGSSSGAEDQSDDGYWFTHFKGLKTNKMGESLPMDSLDQHTQHRWINNKVVCEHFPFDMYQNQFLMSIRDEMFSVEKWLGGGSFGRVFLARPVSNRYVGTLAAWVKQRFSKKSLRWSPTGGRCLAIKFLDKAGGAHDIEMINKRFPYHENVSRPRFWLSSGWTTGRDLHVAPTNPFFIVPYLPLGDLSQYIPKNKANRKPLPPRFVRRIAHQALKGLEHMHRHGFIHLDIKPANLMLSSEGILKLVDFGEIETFQTKANSRSFNAADGERQLDSKYTDFVRHKTYDSGLRGTTLFHAPELSAPLTCGTVMKRGKEVKELFTKQDRGGMRFAYSKQWEKVRDPETGEMEETGELEDTTCGFNSKVDIYALGISLLSMACGFQLLVKEKVTAQEARHGDVGHDGDRLRCCELLGTLVYDDNTGELLVDAVNFERLSRCVPPEYRHWVRDGNGGRTMGDGDFVKFIASMVCNVGKRKSAIELLRKKSKQNQRSWLRCDAAEVSAGASPVGDGGSGRVSVSSSASGTSPRYPKEEASDEEFCRVLLEHATDPEFVEDALKYFPSYLYIKDAKRWVQQTGSSEPTVRAYSGTMSGNACGNQGFRPAQVRKIYDILHVELQRMEAQEIVRSAKLQNIVVHNMAKFLGEAWPDVAADASEKELKKAAKYDAAGLRKLVVEYCEVENIIHAAQLDLARVAQLCLAFYSGKRHRTFREKYAGAMLTKFREQLQSQFELVCSQQVHRFGHTITAERVVPLTLRARWAKSPKCGWVWMRKIRKAVRGDALAHTLSGQMTLRHGASSYPVAGEFAEGERVDDTILAGRKILPRSDSVESVPKAPLAEHVTPDMFKWHKLFMVLQDGCLSCYRTIMDSVLEVEQVEFMELRPGIDASCIDATEEIPMPLKEPHGFRIANVDTTWWLCVDPGTCDAPKNEYKTSKDGNHNTWLDAVSSVLSGRGAGERRGTKSTLEKMRFDREGCFKGLVESSRSVDQHGPGEHRALRGEKKDPSCQFWSHLEVSLPEESQQDSQLRAWTAAAGLTRHPTRQTYRVSVPLHYDDNEKSFSLEPRLGCWTHFVSDPSEIKRNFTLEDVCAHIHDSEEEREVVETDRNSKTLARWNSVKNVGRGVVGFLSAAAKAAGVDDDCDASEAPNSPNSTVPVTRRLMEEKGRQVHDIELDSLRADMRRMAKTLSALEKFIKDRVEKLEQAVLREDFDQQVQFRLASNQSTVTVEAESRGSNTELPLMDGVEEADALSEDRCRD